MNNLENKIKLFIENYNAANHEQAKEKANNLIEQYPNEIKLLQSIAVLFIKNKKINDAILIFSKILDIDPDSIETLINISLAYYELNNLDLALKYLEKAKALNIRQDEVYFSFGLIYEKNKNITRAILSYKKSIQFNSSNPDALINLGNIYLQNKDYQNAKLIFEKTIILQPNNPDLYHNLGIVLTGLNNITKAIEFYSKAQELDSHNPLTYYNLGILCFRNSKIYDSITCFKKAIKLKPEISKFYYNLALAETELGKYYSAIENYKSAIHISNDYFSAKYNLARLYLATENFNAGWSDFEIRHYQDNVSKRIQEVLNLRQWNGKKFDGKLFIHGEQGIGDLILHSSIISDLNKIQPNIYLIVDERLVSLYRRSFQNIKIQSYNSNFEYKDNDRHITLASLGSFFRKIIKDFPKKPESYILPDSDKVNKFKRILSQNKKIKIGVSWRTTGRSSILRTILLNQMAKFLTLSDVEFINLQYGNTSEERKKFKDEFGIELVNFNSLDLMNDFEGFSALIASCDLIITISNVTAHFAGAIGKETWVIVPIRTQWHWFHERNNSLWYPNVKLFRQQQYGKWEDIIDKIYYEIVSLL